MGNELILIDASWVIHRMHHVHHMLGVNLKNGQYLQTGHLYGTARLIKSLTENYSDADIIFCLDGMATHGKTLDVNYKADRAHGTVKHAFDDLGAVVEMLSCYPQVKIAFHRHLEADEIMSYLADFHKKDYKQIIIYSGDCDMVQLISDNVFVSTTFDKGRLILVGEKEYQEQEKYTDKFVGCRLDVLPLFRAMVGDSSDNLAGFPKMRKKLAKELAEEFGGLQELSVASTTSTKFPHGFLEFLPKLRTNYAIMKLPTVAELSARGHIPLVYKQDDHRLGLKLFSLYRIKSTSPVPVVELSPDEEDKILVMRDQVNEQWKHPNSK